MTETPGTPPREQRKHPRYPVMWSGTLSSDSAFDLYVLDCRISNFSISGVHVLVERTLVAGRPVTLDIRGVGAFKGRIAWADGDRIGVAFDDAPDHVAALTRDKL
ncbi:MAG: PilZ domain-containing protein [Rhodospirillales bacterium]